MSDSLEKVCNSCNISLPLSDFYKNKACKDGHLNQCKACKIKYQTEYAQNNKKHISEYQLGYGAKYREDNKEREALRDATWRKNNKERIASLKVIWRKNNAVIINANYHKRRARKLNNGGSFTPEQIRTQDQRQKNKCYYCHEKMGKAKTIEHVIPLSRGGSNDISNIVLACSHCNYSKCNKLPHEWVQGGRLL